MPPMLQDISLGGVRIYSHDPVSTGARFELEIFLPDATSFTCRVEVVWVEALPPHAPARHDVGLHFIELREADRHRLEQILDLG